MDKKYDWVSGHFTASSSVSKAEFKELLQKAVVSVDTTENYGRIETSHGFLTWRFYDNNEEEEQGESFEGDTT